MIRKLMSVLILIACLCASSACAQAIYTPGERASSYFLDAFQSGKIIEADARFSLAADAEAMGLAGEEIEALNAITEALNLASFSLGAGLIQDGLRVELGAQYAAQTPIQADAALNLTRDGILVETSLLEGESVAVTWETLLALCGLESGEIQAVMSLRDQDLSVLAAQIVQSAEMYMDMAAPLLSPYAETVFSFLSSLPVEIHENVPADGFYPEAAKEIAVLITARDLGVLITQLADQLESDPALSLVLSMALAQQEDLPLSSTKELCDTVRSAAAAMTDTDHPLVFILGLDAQGAPLYASVSLEDESGMMAALDLIRISKADGRTELTVNLYTADAQAQLHDGFCATLAYAIDPENAHVYTCAGQFSVYTGGEPVLSLNIDADNASVLTPEGQNGYVGKQTFAMDMADGSETLSFRFRNDARSEQTSAQGEHFLYTGSIDVYAEGIAYPITFANEFIFNPHADGPEAVYTENGSIHSIGLDQFSETYTLSVRDYDPAETAALRLTQLETVSSADMQALTDRFTQSVQALAASMEAVLPPEVMQLIAESL